MIFKPCLLKYLFEFERPMESIHPFKMFVFCSHDESCISKVTFVVQVSSNLLEISRFMWVLLSGSPLSLLGTISFFLVCFDCRHGSSLLHNTQYGHSQSHSFLGNDEVIFYVTIIWITSFNIKKDSNCNVKYSHNFPYTSSI